MSFYCIYLEVMVLLYKYLELKQLLNALDLSVRR